MMFLRQVGVIALLLHTVTRKAGRHDSVGLCAWLPLVPPISNTSLRHLVELVLHREVGAEPSHTQEHQVVNSQTNSYMGCATRER